MSVTHAEDFRSGVAEAERQLWKKLRPYRLALFHDGDKQIFTVCDVTHGIETELQEKVTVASGLTTIEKVFLDIAHPFTMLVAWYYLNEQNKPAMPGRSGYLDEEGDEN